MTAIGTQGTGLRHVRKTITFTGGAGAGAVGTVTAFTITGKVVVTRAVATITSSVTDAGGTATVGFGPNSAGWEDAILSAHNKTTLTAGSLWGGNSNGDLVATVVPWAAPDGLAVQNNLVFIIANEAVTGGVIIVDVWYYAITDNGALAGDDIDTELVAAIWANATRTLTALGFTLGASDLAADTITASKIAADAITAAKIATGAVDADALATDAVTEIVTAMLTTAMTESYNADGAAPTLAQALFLLIAALTEFSISGTTITAKKLDGSTTAATFTLNSSTTPTSRTRAT